MGIFRDHFSVKYTKGLFSWNKLQLARNDDYTDVAKMN